MSRLPDRPSPGRAPDSIRRRWAEWRSHAVRVVSLILCALQIGCGSSGEDLAPYSDLCSQVACRPAYLGTMYFNFREGVGFPVQGGPYVHDGRIFVLRGEEFRVEPRISQGEIKELQYLANAVSPRSTFFLGLQRRGAFTVLDFENPFSETVFFRAAAIQSETQRQGVERFCAIAPQEQISEHWSRRIDGVVIYGVAFADPGIQQKGCVPAAM